jgi:hypothetical protein
MVVKGELTKLIDAAILDSRISNGEHRSYVGASSIGGSCSRSIWYAYNNYPREPYTSQQLRTFSIGKRLEGIVLDCLEDAGLKIARTWYDLSDKDIPEFQGHIDAMWCHDNGDAKAIIEVKTARDSSFKIFVNRGLKYWYPVYYAQIQSYMGMSDIHEAYVIALNKDNSELHDDKVLFDALYYEDLKRKVKGLLEAKDPPDKINNSPLYFVCRGCRFKSICHG